MKNLVLSMTFVLTLVAFSNAQDYAKIDKSVMDAAYFPPKAPLRTFAKSEEKKVAQTPKVRVIYSRPLKKGRTIFGKLLKFGEPWRLGANESTEILFMTDVQVGETTIKAGRYSMIAIPTADEWTIKFNTGLDGWGNYSYDATLDIASISVPTQTSNKEIEALSMAFYEKSPNTIHLKIGWDKTFAELPIVLK